MPFRIFRSPAPLFLLVALMTLIAIAVAIAKPARKGTRPEGVAVTKPSLYSFELARIDGSNQSLADYKGRALLIVNTASRCGFTPQYESLEAIRQQYKDRGFEVLAFPANDFMGQEPGTNAEIQKFCSTRFHTTFPLFAKLSVKGKQIAPLYQYLTADSPFPGDIGWNFTKFLVDREGQVVARFGSSTDPRSPEVTQAIERVLPPAPAN